MSKEPTVVGAWIIGGAIASFFVAPLFFMLSAVLFGTGLIVLAYEIEPGASPWPNGSKVSKGLVIAGAACILSMVVRLASPLWVR
jgi:hypothetical protein